MPGLSMRKLEELDQKEILERMSEGAPATDIG